MEENTYIKKYHQATKPKHFIIKLILEGYKGNNDYPKVRICVNQNELHNDFVKGQETIEVAVKDLSTIHTLSIEMINKIADDTVTDRNNNIISDKFVKICAIFIDEVNIRNYLYEAKQKPIYHFDGQGPEEVFGDSLFFPGEWRLTYGNPPRQYFAVWSGRTQLDNSREKQKVKNQYLKEILKLIK